jgi:hypothetical protein
MIHYRDSSSASHGKTKPGSIRERKGCVSRSDAAKKVHATRREKQSEGNMEKLLLKLTPTTYFKGINIDDEPIETSDRSEARSFSSAWSVETMLDRIGGTRRWGDAVIEVVP